MTDLLEDAVLLPPPNMPVDGVPGREVAGHYPPGDPTLNDMADDMVNPVRQFPHRMFPLRSVPGHQR